MPTPTSFGRTCFAISLIAFGVLHVVAGDFVTGRAPAWPAGVPGQLVWAWLSGLVVAAAGAAILVDRRAFRTASIAAAFVAVWSLARHVPLVLADRTVGGEWTQAGKALVVITGLLVVGGTRQAGAERRFVWAGRIGLGVFMLLTGVQHFLFTPFVATLVPGWIPGAVFWTRFAGIALITGGAGLLLPRVVHVAALLSGAMILSWVPLVHLPLALTEPDRLNEWQAFFEAFGFAGIAFVIAGLTRRSGRT